MNAPILRNATLDDVDTIVVLVTVAYRGTGDDSGWTTESELLDGQRTNPEEISAAITDDASAVLVAERDGRVAGVIKVSLADPDGAMFGLFAVNPREQSGGTGSLLLDEAERIARVAWGRNWMELEVLRPRTDLQAWYRRRGYEPTGRTTPFPYGDERFGVPRTDDLVFEVFRRSL